MILAAGLGTRLKPLTDTMPKALVPVGGKPLLDIQIEKLAQAGYDRFVVNVHHFAQQIIDHVNDHYPQNTSLTSHSSPLTSNQSPIPSGGVGGGLPLTSNQSPIPSGGVGGGLPLTPHILISDETSELLETGGGLKKAQGLFRDDEPILIHNVDILDNVDYDWFRRQHQDDEDAVLLVSKRKTKRYLLFDSAMRLMGWKNIETGEVKSPFPWLREAEITIDDNLQVTSNQSPIPSGGAGGGLSIPSGGVGGGLHLYAFAFSGIHSFSPRLFPLMDRFPDRFPIIDFYLSVCHRSRIVGLVKNDLQVLDVGKLDSLEQAERFTIGQFTI